VGKRGGKIKNKILTSSVESQMTQLTSNNMQEVLSSSLNY